MTQSLSEDQMVRLKLGDVVATGSGLLNIAMVGIVVHKRDHDLFIAMLDSNPLRRNVSGYFHGRSWSVPYNRHPPTTLVAPATTLTRSIAAAYQETYITNPARVPTTMSLYRETREHQALMAMIRLKGIVIPSNKESA